MSSTLEKALRTLDSDYVTAAELECILAMSSANARYAQIKRALAQGLLIRLTRGVYRRAGYLEKTKPHPFEIAQHLVWPSYVSLESALSYHGLIPEAIYQTTSVTTQKSRLIQNAFGHFEYKTLAKNNFFIDVQRVQTKHECFYVANPWKALCDYISCHKKDWISMEPALLALRLEQTELPHLTPALKKALTNFYHQKRITNFLQGSLHEY